METNSCDDNHLDSNVLLPPRKRLLAGFKKRNCGPNSSHPSASYENGAFECRLNDLMKYHSRNPSLSLEEIVVASRRAAEESAKAAEAARSVAEAKSVVAAKAMAGAKRALELVASTFEDTCNDERFLKKNKMKKHLSVKLLYNKHQNIGNCNTDEELALKLHQSMNSSPRISKNSNMKSSKHKRLKGLSSLDEPRVTSNRQGGTNEMESEDMIGEGQIVSADEYLLKSDRSNSLKILNGQEELSHSRETHPESSDDSSRFGRKRGRMKQKKLPLSICSFRDLANTKEDLKCKRTLLNEENIVDPVGNNDLPLSYVGRCPDSVKPVDPTSMWKCRAFKVPVCAKQNKVTEP